jgi:uncharacterized membrane protein SpoIIM required for sporulation/ABC-type transport system involved in multi-copper enzyme maturation permease subunit
MLNKGVLDEIRPAWFIARREVRDQFRDWRIIFPVIGLTLIFPFIMNWTARQMLDFVSRYGATLIGERMVPFLLMIVGFFPISVSLVIALESFVGEKERGSIEPLLNTPLKDWQLYLGKLIAATVPPLVSSFLGMSVYLVGLIINHIPWPAPGMLTQIIVLTVVQAVMMVSGAVVVSAQATSVRAANLLASFIIIPSAFLIQWEAMVMFWGNFDTLWWVVFGVLVLTVLLVRVGMAHFRREELLGREIDVLRLAWSWKVFWNAFTGGARNPIEWYRRIIPMTVKRLLLPSLLVFGIVVAGVWIGVKQADRFPFLFDPAELQNARQNLDKLQEIIPTLGARSFMLIWWQNVRVLLISMVIGLFTFGVVGVMPLMITMGLVGYLMGMFAQNGVDPLPIVFGLLLPHGVFEIPAAILATAAVLHAGASLATPDPKRSVGEVWLESLADWVKIMLGVVIPLLLVASAVEVWVTPRIAMLVLSL